MEIPFISEAVVAELLSVRDAMEPIERALRDQARGHAENLPRQRLHVGTASLHMLAASWAGGGVYGQKVYSIGAGGAQFWVLLYRTDGRPYALIEAQRLGQVRTGAATGVATRALARPDASRVGVIGSGYQMRSQVEAICAVRPVEEVRAWSPTRERLQAFCSEMSNRLGLPVRAARSATEAVAEADIVVTLTTASTPVLGGEDLQSGTHLNICGSNRIQSREVGADVVRMAACVVTDDVEQARIESGDLVGAVADGALQWDAVQRLADVVADPSSGRKRDQDITLFKSHGVGLWDVAVAAWIAERAIASERFVRVPLATGPDVLAPALFHGTTTNR